MQNEIKIEDLSFSYAGSSEHVLKKISLDIKKGQFVLLIGPSGSGKSTLCLTLNRVIPLLIKGDLSGRILINGEDISSKTVAEMGRTVGIVFQDYESQLFSTRVDLEVAFALENRGMDRREMIKRVGEALEITGLKGYEGRVPATLSGGQKQRLAIASILAMEPEILVLDEPLTDLDPAGRRSFLEVLYRLREKGKTIVFVDHDHERIIPDTCAVLNEGELIDYDSPIPVFQRLMDKSISGIKPHPFVELCKKTGRNCNSLEPEKIFSLFREKIGRVKKENKINVERVSGENIIEFENVSFIYQNNNFRALEGINLNFKKGDFVALVGQNGSGKTTLAKHIVRLLTPTEGTVRLFGENTGRMKRSEVGKKVGYVFQNPDHQIFSETVYDEVAFAPRNFKLPRDEIDFNVRRALDTVGLTGKEKLDPFALQRGERQKVAVASILSISPEVLILDEPTTGLDNRERINTMEMLKKLNEEGKTIIIITHSMDIVAEYAKTVIAMNSGRIIFQGGVREFFSNPEIIKKASLEPPLITELGWKFGITALTVNDFLEFVND